MVEAAEQSERTGWRKRAGRLAYRVGRLPVIMYVVVFFLGWILQEKLIFPGSWMSQGKAAAVVTPQGDEQVVPLTTRKGEHIFARFGLALTARGARETHPERCPTLLYFYGNGECLVDQDWQMGEFRKLGMNVIIPEYPGYGMTHLAIDGAGHNDFYTVGESRILEAIGNFKKVSGGEVQKPKR